MFRTPLAAAFLLAIPGPQAWAQVAAVRVVPVPVSAVRFAPPALAAPGLAPLLPSASSPKPVLPSAAVLPGPLLPVMPAPSLSRGWERVGVRALDAKLAPETNGRGPLAAGTVLEAVAEQVAGPTAAAGQAAPTLRTAFDGSFLRAPEDAVAVPVTAASSTRPRLAPYMGGTFLQQAANNAVHVTLPLAVLTSGGSLASAAVVVAVAGWADSAGTMLGGRLSDRFHPLNVVRAVTAARVAALAAVPVVLATGGAAVVAVGAAFIVDALARGVADTARNTLPLAYAGKGEGALAGFNARFQTFFEAGALVGPFLVGALLTAAGAAAGQWLAPAALAGAALLYMASPRPAMPSEGSGGPAGAGWGAVRKHLLSKPAALAAFVGLAALTLYPLRAVLPAVWAVDLLTDPASAAWLVGAFGAGGLAGSLLFRAAHARLSPAGWVYGAVAGTAALALAWLPGAFLPLAAGVALFSASNVAARLSLTSVLQAGSPDGLAGGVMGASRLAVNLTAMGVKAAAAAALAVAAGSLPALGLVAGGMAVFGGIQIWSARRLATAAPAELSALGRPSAEHGLPGRLIVVEGLDGSGKSTQLDILRERLESEGRQVVVTVWNSSGLVSEGVKRAKKDEDLTPRAFALAQAADLADRVEHVVLPALRAGKVVLADRWVYTGVARDTVRGSDKHWVERLYDFAPKPDLVLYYRAPVDTAVGRVLKRSGRASLSEDGEPEEGEHAPRVKFYEGGLDLKLDADPVGNFKAFQARVTAVYDRLAEARGFHVLDAGQGVAELAARTAALSESVLGPARGGSRPNGVFDKDPAGDAENIRENYKNEKRGLHFYFRNMLLPMQERFSQLVEHAGIPNVFLHGNPHVDNYAKTLRGGAMADFDRSRRGPYAWDLTRFMVSLSLRQKTPHHALLPKGVLKALLKGYRRGFEHPERGWEQMRELAGVTPEPWELTVNGYVEHGGKWLQELRESPVAVDDSRVLKLVGPYLDRYDVEEAGKGHGSMGFRDLVLVLLRPKAGGDRVLLNIKAVRSDPDTRWYKNPAPNDGERMLRAAKLYAPGWEDDSARAVLDGVEYYVRRIPPHNVKLKKSLDRDQLEDLAYAVGTQLGRGHRLSVAGEPASVLADLAARFDDYVAAALAMRDEVSAAHRRYLKALRKLEEVR